MVRFVTHSTPAGHHYDAVDRLASRFATKRRSQRARAGLSSMLLQRLRRGPRLAREQLRGPPPRHTNGCVQIPDPCGRRGRAERRTGGPTDAKKAPPVVASRRPHRGSAHRPTPRRTLHTRVLRARPRPAQTAHASPPRSRRTRPSARSGRSRRRWPRTGPSPSGSACARATRSAGTRSGGTGAARSSAFKLSA